MDCFDCKYNPSFFCHCNSTYLCDIDIVNHLKLNLKHDLENLSIKLDSNDKILLEKELNARIKTLIQIEQKIIKNAVHLIKIIEEKSKKTLQEINNLLKHYIELKNTKNIKTSNINEIRSIINSKLSLNYINTRSVKREIDAFYSKQLYDITSDEVETTKIRKLNFLKKYCSSFICMAISSDGNTLIAGSDDSCIRIWDLPTHTLISCLTNHKSKVTCLDLSLDNNLFVSGSWDRTIILWSFKEKNIIRSYSGHSKEISFVLLTNESTFILSGSLNMELMLWRTDSNELIKKICL